MAYVLHGHPFSSYVQKVTTAFYETGKTYELRLLADEASFAELRRLWPIGLMPVLARHAVDPEKFEETTFKPLIGSGPYVFSEVNPGRSITLKRDQNYWGRDIAISRGFWNFDEVRTDFYRDANSHLEAFTKGLYDVRTEFDPSRWETAYNVPAVRDGRIVKDEAKAATGAQS